MPDLRWDADLGRYRTADGRFVSRTQIRETWELSLANLSRRTDTLAMDLRGGRVSLEEWRTEMRTVVKQVQMAAAELATGGRAQMTQQDYGTVGQQVRRQYEYLENWVNEIKAGIPFDARMEQRATLYLKSGRAAFLAAERDQLSESGMRFARNILHAQESCWQCIAESDRGWVPVEVMSLPGTRVCLGNCRCNLQYSREAA